MSARRESWLTRSWRPALAYALVLLVVCSALTVFFGFMSVIMLRGAPEILGHMPGMLGAVAAIVAGLSPILTVASYWRGKMQAGAEFAQGDVQVIKAETEASKAECPPDASKGETK